jgi:hypothetical protein
MSDDMTGKNQYLAVYPVPKNQTWCREILKKCELFFELIFIFYLNLSSTTTEGKIKQPRP